MDRGAHTVASNLERVREVYAHWGAGRFEAGAKLFGPTTVVESNTPDGRRTLRGPDAIAGFMRDFLAQWSAWRQVAEAFREEGDSVIVTERQRGTGARSGIETEMTNYAVWTFRGDDLIRVRWEPDEEHALATARGH